jgi:hypothetical protein
MQATGKVKPKCESCAALKKAKKELPKECFACAQMEIVECAECEGTCKTTKKIHGLFGQELFECSYEEVIRDKVKYGKAKSGVFAMTYGGNAKTLAEEPECLDGDRGEGVHQLGTVLSRHRQVTQAD